MNEFNSLRIRAREKRDRSIDLARHEYQAALHRIDELERDLVGNKHSPEMKTGECIDRVMPAGEFTLHDVLNGLQDLDPKRAWSAKAVGNHLLKLRKRGVLQRTKRSTTGCAARYVRVETVRDKQPFEDQPLSSVLPAVLGNRKMTVLEIAVALLESGFRTKMRRKRLTDAIYAAMLREPERFKREGAKWAVYARDP